MTAAEASPPAPARGPSTSGVLVAGLLALLLGGVVGRAIATRPVAPVEAGARAALLLADPEPLSRARTIARLLSRAEPESLNALREAFESAAIEGGDLELILFLEWWANFDPEAALAWAGRDTPSLQDLELGPAVLRAWARSDPSAALARAGIPVEPIQRTLALEAALIGWDESPIPGLGEYVFAMKAQERQQGMLVLARRRVTTLGSADALAWAEGLPDDDPGFKRTVLGHVVSIGAAIDPEPIARWAEPRIDGERSTRLPLRIGVRWVRLDPPAALAWIESLPAGPDRDDGLLETYRDWLTLDAPAARAWMAERADQQWLDPARVLYATSIAPEHPHRAIDIAASLADESVRVGALVRVLRRWIATDRATAVDWLERSDLPPEIKRLALMQRQPGAAPGAAAPRAAAPR